METSDARQPQCYVSHHRRADRRRGRAWLQSLSDQEGTGRPADQRRPGRPQDPEQMTRVAPSVMKISRSMRLLLLALGGAAWLALASSAMARQVSREQDIVD